MNQFTYLVECLDKNEPELETDLKWNNRAVKLSVCLLGISACVAQTTKNNNPLFVIVMVWATQAEIPSKQTLSLTAL